MYSQCLDQHLLEHTCISTFQMLRLHSIYADLAAKLLHLFTVRRCIPPCWNGGSFVACRPPAVDVPAGLLGVGRLRVLTGTKILGEEASSDSDGIVSCSTTLSGNENGSGGSSFARTCFLILSPLAWEDRLVRLVPNLFGLGVRCKRGTGLEARNARLFLSMASFSIVDGEEGLGRWRASFMRDLLLGKNVGVGVTGVAALLGKKRR